MPSIHYLNPPPNPFWDFVAGLEEHPFFAGRAGPSASAPRDNAAPEAAAEASGSGEQARANPQPTAEDPPEVDPATLNAGANESYGGPWRGRGRFSNAFEQGAGESSRRGHGCRGRGGFEGHGGHPRGPPPFMHGAPPFTRGGPWWARHVPGMDHEGHPHPHDDPHHAHHGPGHHSRGPPFHHRGGRGGWGRGGGGRNGPAEGFNLGEFLDNLGSRLGVDLSGAAEGLGLDRFTGPRASGDSDFEPRGDIFDTPSSYIIHVSLPGAKKSDVGVDWDGENSVLRIAGVVHRPGADEELLSQLVVDQRKREVGVFEKNIRLGTRRDPASIDVAAITAKMVDGVLVVKVPKVEVEHQKREVPISASSPPRATENNEKEKESLLDAADEEMYDAASAPAPAAATEKSEKELIAENAHEQVREDARSETMDVEHEAVPAYEEHASNEESDWEKDGSEDEGEYVKINVD